MALTNSAKDAGVGVIDVVYLIDFSDQKRPGFFSFGGLQVNSGLSVAADYSRMTLIAPSGKQTVVTVKAPAWTLFALVALGMVVMGGLTAAFVYFTPWGPRPLAAAAD